LVESETAPDVITADAAITRCIVSPAVVTLSATVP
jgi:hypothetical protein